MMAASEAGRMQGGPRASVSDWIKAVAVALVAGPPIGGLVLGLVVGLAGALDGGGSWASMPAAVLVSIVMSYIIGLPVAALAVVLFLLSYRLVSRGTALLAIACGVSATGLLIVANDVIRQSPGLKLDWKDFFVQLAMFGIPAMIAAWACWYASRPLHKLS